MDPYTAYQRDLAHEEDMALQRMKDQLDDIRQESADMLTVARSPKYSDHFRQLCRNRVKTNRKEAARLIEEIAKREGR